MVTEPFHHFEDVRGEEDGGSVFHQIEEDVLHEPGADRIHALEGLVHEIELRLVNERRRHGDPFPHPFGVLGDQGPLFVGEFEKFHQFSGSLAGKLTGEAVHPAHELQKLEAGEAVEEQRLIGDEADSLLDGRLVGGHVEAKYLNSAGSGWNQPHQHADCGRFSGTIWAEEAKERAAGDREV